MGQTYTQHHITITTAYEDGGVKARTRPVMLKPRDVPAYVRDTAQWHANSYESVQRPIRQVTAAIGDVVATATPNR